jgi:Ca2+-binding RTX toxin-like protein
LSRIKTEDDHAVIVVNGQSIAVEQAMTEVGVWHTLRYAIGINTANSQTEFSGVQGQNNWYYGYYAGSFTSAAYQEMTQFSDIWTVQNGTYYTLLTAGGGHPNGVTTSGGRKSEEQWAVRRWVSEIDGEIQIYGILAKADTGGGNGVIGHIFIDGVEVWSQSIAGTDGTGVNYQITTKVKLNSVVDFAIDPKKDTNDVANDIADTTIFTAQIDALNQTPTNLTLSNSNIGENQAIGTLIGNLSTIDPDSGNTFTYSLVTGTGSTDNALFAITGNQLQSNGIFDFETKNSYSIRVKTNDQGGLSYEKQLTIGISNVDEQRSLSLTPQQDIFINEGLDDTVTGTFTNLLQNDNINGGAGIDTLILSGGTSTDSLEIDASNSSNQLNIAGTTIANFERFDLSGFLGTISFSGYAGNNWIKSGAGNDDLTGDSGNDYLNGGTGTDQLLGWKGNDTYVVDNTGDVIIEALNAGIDSVESSVTWTLKANLENLTLTGTTAINGTGNQLNNILTGNSGNNTLNGALGIDTLIGGAGNDIYVVDTLTDIITENTNEGTDTIQSSVTFSLAAFPNIENLTLTGSSVITGTGNTANNSLTGNTANNTLNGGDGNDTLNGGAGNDSLIGGNGNDYAYYYSSTASVTVNLATGTASDGLGGTDTLSQIENIQGSNTAGDNLTGNTGVNVLYGYGGADILTGGGGNDLLYLGSDTVKDTVNYTSGDGTDTVYNFVRGASGDLLKFTGITAIDVQVSGTSTLFKVGDGVTGNAGFGSGTLLLTTNATSGFVAADVNVNLLGATFAFS